MLYNISIKKKFLKNNRKWNCYCVYNYKMKIVLNIYFFLSIFFKVCCKENIKIIY